MIEVNGFLIGSFWLVCEQREERSKDSAGKAVRRLLQRSRQGKMVAQTRSSGGDEKWLNSGYILKDEPIGFAAALDRGKSSERKREV